MPCDLGEGARWVSSSGRAPARSGPFTGDGEVRSQRGDSGVSFWRGVGRAEGSGSTHEKVEDIRSMEAVEAQANAGESGLGWNRRQGSDPFP